MRNKILNLLYRIFPFDLKGDCLVPTVRDGIRISCVINFYGRLDLLSGILHSLAQQHYDRDRFEVVLVEDKGGTAAGKQLAEQFRTCLQTVYLPLDRNFGSMGYSRNYGLSHCRGEIVLFLDDDTIIMQQDFLQILDQSFTINPGTDAIVPHGHAAFTLLRGRYDFHDSYFMTSRCTAYRREVLAELGGFMDHFVGQEDVEFVIRFLMAGHSSKNVAELNYFHPPLLVPNFRKPKAVGHSFYLLKSKYPLPIWLVTVMNCARHAPLYLLPVRRYREMGRFGIGFMAGVMLSLGKKKGFQYN
jgi:glycosyltransferase involved in cell wall biosynthesis